MRGSLVMMPREFQFKPGESENNGSFTYSPVVAQPHVKHTSQYVNLIFFPSRNPRIIIPDDIATRF